MVVNVQGVGASKVAPDVYKSSHLICECYKRLSQTENVLEEMVRDCTTGMIGDQSHAVGDSQKTSNMLHGAVGT